MENPIKSFFLNSLEFKEEPRLPRRVYLFNLFSALFLVGFLLYLMFTATTYNFSWDAVWEYRQKFIDGFYMTVIISFFSLILSLAIGLFFAYGQSSKLILLRFLSRGYIELIRGTPLLVQILIFFYVFAANMGFDNRYVVGVFILAIFAGAYVAEIFRAGIQSIENEQFEAAKSLGFTIFQSYRYIIFPQAYKRIIPPLTGQFASIIKDSSLLSIISVSEFTMNAQEVNAYTYSTLESYIPLAVGYLLLTYPISLYASHLEKKMKG